MPRLSKSKGQWFILSAVFISGIFLTISSILSSTVPVDNSVIVQKNEDYLFNAINMKVDDICSLNKPIRKLKGFIYNARDYLNKHGYLLEFNFSSCDQYNLTIKTSRMKAGN